MESTVELLHSRKIHLRGGETAFLLLLLLGCLLGSLLQIAGPPSEGKGARNASYTPLGMGAFLGKDGNRQEILCHKFGRVAPRPPTMVGTHFYSACCPLTHRRVPVHPRIPALSFGVGGTTFILARSYSLLPVLPLVSSSFKLIAPRSRVSWATWDECPLGQRYLVSCITISRSLKSPQRQLTVV